MRCSRVLLTLPLLAIAAALAGESGANELSASDSAPGPAAYAVDAASGDFHKQDADTPLVSLGRRSDALKDEKQSDAKQKKKQAMKYHKWVEHHKAVKGLDHMPNWLPGTKPKAKPKHPMQKPAPDPKPDPDPKPKPKAHPKPKPKPKQKPQPKPKAHPKPKHPPKPKAHPHPTHHAQQHRPPQAKHPQHAHKKVQVNAQKLAYMLRGRNLPSCAKTCMFNLVNLSGLTRPIPCQLYDAGCYCSQANWGYALRDCMYQSCGNGNAAVTGIQFGQEFCVEVRRMGSL